MCTLPSTRLRPWTSLIRRVWTYPTFSHRLKCHHYQNVYYFAIKILLNLLRFKQLLRREAAGNDEGWNVGKGKKVLFHDDVSDQMTRANNWKSQKFLSLINVNSESWELKRPPAPDDPSISFTVNASLRSGEFARSNLPSRISPLHSATINFIRE